MSIKTNQIITFGLVIAVIVSAGIIFWYKAPLLGKKYIKIKDATVFIEIANNDLIREKGLGHRNLLDQDKGMLFQFDQARQWPFWMKGMSFPLDFVWIRDGRVVDLSKNIPTQTDQKPVYVTPKENITSVLEVNAGWIDKYNIQIGDTVQLND